ncbi:NadS family protein [Massilia sp. BJB1822]|uniref:NadS family protein n=1 Tax=Massilia sp. BJB1822 TaxID=2744470 RepID=UPI0015934A04|nr:NadS family protein [Massilia sp. BJB1822]NVD99051.1 helix-turn-helix domain-containing protein [Massilia sp. BJB1822]
MEQKLFEELSCSLKEAAAIAKGELVPARKLELSRQAAAALAVPDAKAIREQTGLSQRDFALALQVSVKTVRSWEQRQRVPSGPAQVLLKLLGRAPELVLPAIQRG